MICSIPCCGSVALWFNKPTPYSFALPPHLTCTTVCTVLSTLLSTHSFTLLHSQIVVAVCLSVN